MQPLTNSREPAFTAVTRCHAAMHKGKTVFWGHSDRYFEKSHMFQTDTSLDF